VHGAVADRRVPGAAAVAAEGELDGELDGVAPPSALCAWKPIGSSCSKNCCGVTSSDSCGWSAMDRSSWYVSYDVAVE